MAMTNNYESSQNRAMARRDSAMAKRAGNYNPVGLKLSNKKPEDEFSDYDKYENRVQAEAAKYRQQADVDRAKGRADAAALVDNPPQGLSDRQRTDMRNQRQSQISNDLSNYNRMLSGQQGVRGVRGGSTIAAQRELQNSAQDKLSEYERGLSELDSNLSMKKLAAIYGGGESEVAQNALANQSAYDKIKGYLQDQEQKKLVQNSKYYRKI